MNCEEARKDFSALLDGELTPPERERVEAHLSECADCLRELDSFKRVDLFYRALPEQTAPHGFEERIRKALRPSVIHLATAHLRRKPVWPLLLAAAMFTVVLGGVWYRLGPKPESMQVASAPPAADKAYTAHREMNASKMEMADQKADSEAAELGQKAQVAESVLLAPEPEPVDMAEESRMAGRNAATAEPKNLDADTTPVAAPPVAAAEERPAPEQQMVAGRPSMPGQAAVSPPKAEPPSARVEASLPAVSTPAPPPPPPAPAAPGPAARQLAMAAPSPPPVLAKPPAETGVEAANVEDAGISQQKGEAPDTTRAAQQLDKDEARRTEKRGEAEVAQESVGGMAGATADVVPEKTVADEANGISPRAARGDMSLQFREDAGREERSSITTATLGSRLTVDSDVSREQAAVERAEAPRLVDRTLESEPSWSRESEGIAPERSAAATPPAPAANISLGAAVEAKKKEPAIGSRTQAGKREFELRDDGWCEQGYAGETCREFTRDSREAAALVKANPDLSELLEYGKPLVFRVQTTWYRILPPRAAH